MKMKILIVTVEVVTVPHVLENAIADIAKEMDATPV
jgi:hypothetical protein